MTRALRWTLRLVAFALLLYALLFGWVWHVSRRDERRPSDAIVVLGAAQYNGVPSPDLQARLDEALLLYRKGDAKLIAVTGNKEPGDQFTEAETGARYLESKGVPATDIVEAGGDDSWANLSDVAPELKARGATTVLMVTDPFHEDRSMAIATDVGLTPHPTPTQTSPIKGWSTVPYFLKEAVGVSVGRIIGYDHLHALG